MTSMCAFFCAAAVINGQWRLAGMPHDVGIPDFHRFAHFAGLPMISVWSQIIHIDALPSLVGNAALTPLAPASRDGLPFTAFIHCHSP
jgi:hypothetical protein